VWISLGMSVCVAIIMAMLALKVTEPGLIDRTVCDNDVMRVTQLVDSRHSLYTD